MSDEKQENGAGGAEVDGHVRPPDDHVPVRRADGQEETEEGSDPEPPEGQRARAPPLPRMECWRVSRCRWYAMGIFFSKRRFLTGSYVFT